MDFESTFFETNDFELTNKKIGEGAFGKVYIAENQSQDTQFAVKIISNNGELSGHDQMMFLRESLILRKLTHPAIVKFIGINFHSFENPDKLEPTIITEYLPHGSLKEILKKEQNSIADDDWNPTKKYICLLGIADAMRYLHHHGIIHRDLKPENILIDENFYPRICDFGLSRCFSMMLTNSIKLSMTGNIGTPLYMAPELMMDEDKYGAGVDVYSFAILTYEIVCGKEPFSLRGKPIKFADLCKKVISGGRPEFTEGVTEKMKDLITQCWSQDCQNRPSFEEIFKKLSSDLSYLDEDVDEDEINDYIRMLKEESEVVPPLPTSTEMQDLKSKNDELEKVIKKLTDENAQLKKDKEKATDDVRKLTDENAQLKKDKEKATDDVRKLTDENAQLKKDKEKATNDVRKLTDENAQLKKDKEKATDDVKKLTDENAQLKKDKEKATDDVRKLTDENIELKKSKRKDSDDKNLTKKDTEKRDKDKREASKKEIVPSPLTSNVIKNTDNINYDVIALGTGLKECLLAGLLSLSGKRVLQIDRNSYYGSECASLNLTQFFKKFHNKIPPKELGNDSQWNIDLIPKFIMSDGLLTKILVKTKVDDMMKFLSSGYSFVYKDKKVEIVPSNTDEALSTSLVGFMGKRRVKNFLEGVNDYLENPTNKKYSDISKLTAKQYMEKSGLDPSTMQFIGHFVALEPNDSYLDKPAIEMISKLNLYANSVFRFNDSKSPFLYPMYGIGDLSQSFARLCAINGGTYMPNHHVNDFIYEGKKVVGVKSGSFTAKAPVIIGDPSYFSKISGKTKSIGKRICAICFLSHEPSCIPKRYSSRGSCNIILPSGEINRKNDIYIFITSSQQKVCLPGWFIAIVSTVVETKNPEKEISAALSLLGKIQFKTISVSDLYEPCIPGSQDNIFCSSSYDITVHFESTVEEVLKLYEEIIGKPFDF